MAGSESSHSFPFKRLPREIRDPIYDYVFEWDEVAVTNCHPFNWQPPLSDYLNQAFYDGPQYLLTLLSVDRQISQEATERFYTRTTFTFTSEAGAPFLRGIGLQRLRLIWKVILSMRILDSIYHFDQRHAADWCTVLNYMGAATSLQRLEIHPGRGAAVMKGFLAKDRMATLDLELVVIKSKVKVTACISCNVEHRDSEQNCESRSLRRLSVYDWWDCHYGQIDWDAAKWISPFDILATPMEAYSLLTNMSQELR